MGGYGSGRTSKVGRRPRNKTYVGSCFCLNSFDLMPGKVATRLMEKSECRRENIGCLVFVITPEKLDIFCRDSLIMRASFQPVFSGLGTRYYFSCPGCGMRTSRLYLKQTFACRKCHNLTYHSQNISNEDRWLLRREKLLKRHGLTFEQVEYYRKKKWMHQKTFERVVREFNFINDMGINIHLDRFDYKRNLKLLRDGREAEEYSERYSRTVINRLRSF